MSSDSIDNVDPMFYLEVITRRRWIVLACTFILCAGSTLLAFTTSPVFRSSALLIIEKPFSAGAGQLNNTLIETNHDDYYQTQYKILKSYSLIMQVHEKLGLKNDPEFGDPEGVEKLSRAITIRPVARSRLVYIDADSLRPEQATRIANTLAQTYVDNNLSNQLFISQDTLKALHPKPGPEALKSYEALPAVVSSSLINGLKTDLSVIETRIGDLSQRYTQKHPELRSLNSTQTALQARINAEIQNIVQSLKTELSGQYRGNNVRIIDDARTPLDPYKPKKPLFVLGGLMAGLAIGVIIAVLIELFDQSIRNQEDVEKKLNLPFLALIPLLKQEDSKAPYAPLLSPTPSLTSESFKNLRTMVELAGFNRSPSTLLITSTMQSEGKTHISSNLAVVFAQLGEKVLLIDGDLRRPKLHKNFKLSSARGLSNFLSQGKDPGELADLIHDTEISGLSVLPCGPRPPNPSELLNTPRLGALIKWASENYDRVLIDCAPIFPISDTILWGKRVSQAIFVVRHATTRAPLITSATQKLEMSGVKILGILVNAAVRSGLTYAYSGNYYQYYHSYAEDTVAKSP